MGRCVWQSVVLIVLFTAWVCPATPLTWTGQGEYVVGSPDVLSITVFGEAAMSGKYTVGSDGEFTFPLVGRVKAAGPHGARHRG